MESIFDTLRHGKRMIERSQRDRRSGSSALPTDENTGMVFVDGDNLRGYVEDTGNRFDLDAVIDWLTPENTGIDRIVDVHVFSTKVTNFKLRWDVNLKDPNRFCVHTYFASIGEKGYPDDELYRFAWKEAKNKNYRTGVFISNDKGFSEAAKRLRNGFYNYSHSLKPLKEPPEFLIISSFYGKTPYWIEKSEAIDLDRVLFEQGLRGPVNRPTQP